MSKKPRIIEFYGVQTSGKTTLANKLNRSLKSDGIDCYLISDELKKYKNSAIKLVKLVASNGIKYLKIWYLLYELRSNFYKSARRALLILAAIDIVNNIDGYEILILDEGIFFYIYTYFQYSRGGCTFKPENLTELLKYAQYEDSHTTVIRVNIPPEQAANRANMRKRNDNEFDSLELKKQIELIKNSQCVFDYIYNNCGCDKKIEINGEIELDDNLRQIRTQLRIDE